MHRIADDGNSTTIANESSTEAKELPVGYEPPLVAKLEAYPPPKPLADNPFSGELARSTSEGI